RPMAEYEAALEVVRSHAEGVLAGERSAVVSLSSVVREWLSSGKPAVAPDRSCLHWPLEFPEVMADGGFDAVVGNPPFQGGQRISGALGTGYRDHLVRWLAADERGSADLVSYFFLRAAHLSPTGRIGLLATNTIG